MMDSPPQSGSLSAAALCAMVAIGLASSLLPRPVETILRHWVITRRTSRSP